MARKPTISPTKIAMYLACPVRYRWTYIDDRGRWYLRAKSYYSFGATLHKVLQRFHDSGDVGVETTSQVLGAYEDSWIDAGFRSAEEMSEAFGEGLSMLEQHLEQEAYRPEDVQTLFVEKQLKADLGDFMLIGRLDRVDEYPDGTIEVVDYKTGRSSVSADDVANDIAMGVYQLLLAKKYPDRPIRARILALRSGESACHSMTGHAIEQFESTVRQIGAEIVTEDFYERRPVAKALCSGCDFLPLCERDPSY